MVKYLQFNVLRIEEGIDTYFEAKIWWYTGVSIASRKETRFGDEIAAWQWIQEQIEEVEKDQVNN